MCPVLVMSPLLHLPPTLQTLLQCLPLLQCLLAPAALTGLTQRSTGWRDTWRMWPGHTRLWRETTVLSLIMMNTSPTLLVRKRLWPVVRRPGSMTQVEQCSGRVSPVTQFQWLVTISPSVSSRTAAVIRALRCQSFLLHPGMRWVWTRCADSATLITRLQYMEAVLTWVLTCWLWSQLQWSPVAFSPMVSTPALSSSSVPPSSDPSQFSQLTQSAPGHLLLSTSNHPLHPASPCLSYHSFLTYFYQKQVSWNEFSILNS